MRTFLALIRRECQERRGIFIAIGIFAGFALAATMLAGSNLAESGVLDLGNVGTISGTPYFLLAFVLTFFYLTGALHGDRRDRSVYFWRVHARGRRHDGGSQTSGRGAAHPGRVPRGHGGKPPRRPGVGALGRLAHRTVPGAVGAMGSSG